MGPERVQSQLFILSGLKAMIRMIPIADATRGIFGWPPCSQPGTYVVAATILPIDVLQSLSRTMPFVVPPEQVMKANEFRELMAAYNDVEDLVSIGAYKRGSKPISDRAIDCQDAINKISSTSGKAIHQALKTVNPALSKQ
jgi:flagellar biosynthesis/type III secretory pathway ATPase